MGWDPEHVHQRGHADVTGAAAEKAAEESPNKCYKNKGPKRDSDARHRELNHRWNLQPLNGARRGPKRRLILFGFGAFYAAGWQFRFALEQGLSALPHHET